MFPAARIQAERQETMENADKRGFEVNYNGEVIKPGEVMVPFEYTVGEAANCTNPECIKTLRQGGKNFKAIYKAVPEEWAKDAKAAFNLVENETLGYYAISNSVSMDSAKDEYNLDLVSVQSAEAAVMEEYDRDETLNTFIELMNTLIQKSAKIAYAVLLLHTGIKGEAFYDRMKLSRNPANLVRQQAKDILCKGLANLDVASLRGYKNQFEEEYRAEAYKLLDQIIKMYK